MKGEVSETDDCLCSEIIFETLSWLPVDSLLRFKAVCKRWCSIIEDPVFVEKHMRRAAGRWVYIPISEIFIVSPEEQTALAHHHGLTLEEENSTGKIRIRNPATRKAIDLPETSVNKICRMTMCYIPSTREFKLVQPYKKGDDDIGGYKILTVGTDAEWRSIDFPFSCKLTDVRMDTTKIGGMYYIVCLPNFSTSIPKVACLDMQTEHLFTVDIPQNFFMDWTDVGIMPWEEKLALASVQEGELHVRVLENYRDGKWSDRKIVIPLPFMKDNPEWQFAVPHTLRKNQLLMNLDNEELLLMNTASGQVLGRIRAPEGHKFFYYRDPSLVHLQGMRPVSQTKDESY